MFSPFPSWNFLIIVISTISREMSCSKLGCFMIVELMPIISFRDFYLLLFIFTRSYLGQIKLFPEYNFRWIEICSRTVRTSESGSNPRKWPQTCAGGEYIAASAGSDGVFTEMKIFFNKIRLWLRDFCRLAKIFAKILVQLRWRKYHRLGLPLL